MATNGTFTSGRYGDQYGPWLSLEWTRVETDETNNRSKLRLELRLHSDRSLYFSASKTGYMEGTSFTYTGNFSGTGVNLIKTLYVWVDHASNGTGSQELNAFFDLDISWSGNFISRMRVDGVATIDTIPRASDFNSFTLSNASLNYNTATTINYNLTRKSSAFSHDMELKYGSKVIAAWTTSGTGALTRTLSAAEVNTILSSMSSVTSGTLRLYMQTKSGSSRIGSEVSIAEGVSVNSGIKPTASGLTFSIAGTGRDKTINKYVQNVTKVTASFSNAAGYGASKAYTKITIKRQSDGAASQTISGSSGTIDKAIALSGVFVVEGYVEDSRGRSATVSATFTVEAYSVPSVSKFVTTRQIAVTANVDLSMIGKWSPLGTSNPATVLIQGTDSDGVTTTLYSLVSSTAGTVTRTQVLANQADSKSYTYLVTITDSFGKVTKADSAVGTSFMEMTIRRGVGVGIGKVHEAGALDVAGEAFIRGKMMMKPGPGGPESRPAFQLESGDANGHAYLEWFNNTGLRKAYIGVSSVDADYLTISSQVKVGDAGNVYIGGETLDMRTKTAKYNGVPVFTSDNPVLWSGALYMSDGQNVQPSKRIADCPNGWVLVFSFYNAGSQDYRFSHFFVHKEFAANLHPGSSSPGSYFQMYSGGDITIQKYLFFSGNYIYGYSANNTAPNNRMVLRYVLSF